MAVLTQQQAERYFGLRSMDPMKDLRGVADLIEEAFAQDLDRSGQNALQELRWLSRLKPILWWMTYINPEHTDFLSGFVWEEDGKIVGNITVNRTRISSRKWLISNLAVSKKYRGRGIARSLMDAGLELVREYNGSSVALQVRADNEPAKQLYQSLHFKEISGTTYLWAEHVPLVEITPIPQNLILRVRNASMYDTREAYTLASAATPPLAQKEWPLRQSQFKLTGGESLNEFFRNFLGLGSPVHWVVEDGQRFVAMINVRPGSWRSPHHIELIVHPDWHGYLEKPLISRALVYLRTWRNRPLSIKHSANHTQAIEVYKTYGLLEKQTLIWMKLDL
ncbi:MAG: GNAT family N-acetyltransferase [Anaerolineaceae bacterium]|nr:GNAT family N-acetyltransferase [Anaerolineaceae bacterium]